MHWQAFQTFHWIAGSILAVVWSSRIVEAAFGLPRIADIARPKWDRRPATSDGEPRVSIIVPARNEEEHIRATLTQLMALEYSNYEIIAVNDRSTDRTGQIMDEVADGLENASPESGDLTPYAEADRSVRPTRLKVIHIAELPAGWLGKTHAMWRAGRQATGDWLLFTDADVLFKPDALRRAIAYAEAERADHVVVFPRMIMKSAGERMMIAFFQALFVFGHRPWKVSDPKARDHMGVGAFNMVRRSVYDAVGTYRALKMEVLDDMKLGKVVKNAGFAQRNVFGEDLISLRWAKGAFGIVNNLTKNFFAVLSFRVVANDGQRSWPWISESRAVPRCSFRSGMGANSLRDRTGFHVSDLLRNVGQVGHPVLPFLPASDQHHTDYVHTDAVHVPDPRERWH